MSKQRQRDRAAREAAQAAQAEQDRRSADASRPRQRGKRAQDARDAATRASVEAGRRPSSSHPSSRPPSAGRGRQPVYRQRRFPPLPWRLKLALALAWLSVFALSLVLVPGWQGRIGIMVVATFCLPLIVVIVRDPSRRTR